MNHWHSLYDTPSKKRPGLKNYEAMSFEDFGRFLVRNNPSWGKEDHEQLFRLHLEEAKRIDTEYSEELNRASLETFGKPYHISMYQISGIARDEFSDERKRRLRELVSQSGAHVHIACGHKYAARHRNRFKC